MKSRNLLGLYSLLVLFSACGNGTPKYDATGTFETRSEERRVGKEC